MNKRARILVLDDDTATLRLLQYHLRELPFDFTYCESGVDALLAIFNGYKTGKCFDAFVLDCALPFFDGFTIAEIIRVAERAYGDCRSRIKFFTAYDKTVGSSTLVEKVGGDGFWRKPDQIVELPKLISEWLEEV